MYTRHPAGQAQEKTFIDNLGLTYDYIVMDDIPSLTTLLVRQLGATGTSEPRPPIAPKLHESAIRPTHDQTVVLYVVRITMAALGGAWIR